MSPNRKEGESLTTVELKTNFLGSAKVGEVVSGVLPPRTAAAQHSSGMLKSKNENSGKVIALLRCTQMILAARCCWLASI